MSTEAIKQIQDFTSCSEDVAERALAKYSSIEAAVEALLDGEAFHSPPNPPETNPNNSLVLHNPDVRRWDDPPAQVNPPPPSGQSSQGWQTPRENTGATAVTEWDQRGLAPDNPIQIPDDQGEDDELQRALAMSLQDQGNGSPEERPPTLAENEQNDIDQAIANSIGQLRADSTLEPANVSHEMRDPEAPVALISKVPALVPFAHMLQALIACESVRSSFQAFRPAMTQVTPSLPRGITGTASSPAKRPHEEIEGIRDRRGAVRKPLAATWQMQALASVCAASKRKENDVGELLLSVPQPILRKNSAGSAAHEVLRAYYIHIAQSLRDARSLCEDASLSRGQDQADQSDSQLETPNTFHSLTVSSKEHANGRVTFKEEDLVCASLCTEHAGATIELALELELRSGRVKVVQPANVLAFAIQAPSDADGAESKASLRISPELFLDRFLAEHRPEQCASVDAMSQDAIDRQRILKTLEQRRAVLSKQRETFTTSDLLRVSLAYFEGRNTPAGNTWAAERHAEAASRLKAIAEQLDAEIAALDRRIALEKSSIARQWSRVVAQQDGLFNTPEWKTVRYELRAAFVHDASSSWLYFKQHGQWWRDCEGRLDKSSEDVIFGTEERSLLRNTPYFLLYDRAAESTSEEEVARIPEILMRHIEEDNGFLECGQTSAPLAVPTREGSPATPVTPDSVMESAETTQ